MQDIDGQTPLHSALRLHPYPYIKIITELIRKGAQLNIRDRHGRKALSYASRPDKALIAHTLKTYHQCAMPLTLDLADILAWYSSKDEKAEFLSSPHCGDMLTEAASRNDVDTLTYLLDIGININAKDGAGQTAMQVVVSMPEYISDHIRGRTVSLLIDRNADLGIRNKWGDTPLHIAITYNHKAIVRLLLDAGASRTIKNGMNCNALRWAKGRGRKDMIPQLQ